MGSSVRFRSALAAAAVFVVVASAVISFGFYRGDDGITTTLETAAPPPLVDPAVAIVEDLIAAFNDADRAAFVELLAAEWWAEQWPQSSRWLGEEFRTDPTWFEFHGVLESRIALDGCSSRQPRGTGVALYDVVVVCDVEYTDAVLESVGSTGIPGMLDVGLAGGRVAGTFWAPSVDEPGDPVADLVAWMASHQPHLAAHWLGLPFGEPLYGGELAGVLVEAAGQRGRRGDAPSGDGPRPLPAAHPGLAADAAGRRVVMITGDASLLWGRFEVAPRSVWELTADGSWEAAPAVPGSFWSATVAFAGDRPMLIGIADGATSTLGAMRLEAASGRWEDGGNAAPTSEDAGVPLITLSVAAPSDGSRAFVVGWPPAFYDFDTATSRFTEREIDLSPCLTGSPADAPVLLPDPLSRSLILAAGAGLCRIDPSDGSIEKLELDGPARVYAAAADPSDGSLLLIGEGELWKRAVDGTLETVGQLPAEMLWRNTAMVSRADDVVAFDGAIVWTYDPGSRTWSGPGSG
jgi:hypothetical protein